MNATSTTRFFSYSHLAFSMEDSVSDENMRNFVRTVLQSETTCVEYLRKHGIFTTPPQRKGRKGNICGRTMIQKTRRNKPAWRCSLWKCAAFRSLPSDNDFFGFVGWTVNREGSLVSVILWHWYGFGCTLKWLYHKLQRPQMSQKWLHRSGLRNVAQSAVTQKCCCRSWQEPLPSPSKSTKVTSLAAGSTNGDGCCAATRSLRMNGRQGRRLN